MGRYDLCCQVLALKTGGDSVGRMAHGSRAAWGHRIPPRGQDREAEDGPSFESN